MEYEQEDFLQLSGLQHFNFCRRQWALIHIEGQWRDNYQTTDGELMHKNAHDKDFSENRKDLLVRRGMNVFSARLGVSGECDVLEFHRGEAGIPLPDREGMWQPYPVEYKRGEGSSQESDSLQLCGQAMCLEEMLCCAIPEGALYYGQTRRRVPVLLDAALRARVTDALEEMHRLYDRGYTPRVRPAKACNACSLKEICLPELQRAGSVKDYLARAVEDMP